MIGPHICAVTSAHDFNDDQIFHKQIKSFLIKGWSVTYLCQPSAIVYSHDKFTHKSIPQIKGKVRRLLELRRLFKLCLQVNANVYHLHDPELVLLAWSLKRVGKKVVFDIHEDYKSSILATSMPFKGYFASFWDFLEKKISNKLDLLVCADSYIYKRYSNQNKIVLGNYPPISFVPEVLPVKPEIFTIVYAGGINKTRGIERLILALDKLEGFFQLVLVGPCSDQNLMNLINSRSYITY